MNDELITKPSSPEWERMLEEAAQWQLRLQNEPQLASDSDYLAWLKKGRSAMYAVRNASTTLKGHALAPEIVALREQALVDVRRSAARRSRLPPLRSPLGALAAGVVAAIALGIAVHIYLSRPEIYKTAIGDRRTVTLNDGSRIWLDSDSEVSVRYSRSLRLLTLDRGRARFEDVHERDRPFRVKAGNETVVALGTDFNVERLRHKVLVTLLQGRVAVSRNATARHSTPGTPGIQRVTLKPGQELIAKATEPFRVRPADISAATAWEEGRLVFVDAPLEDAVARVNRYTTKPILVAPSIRNVRVSGVFYSGNIAAFVSAVTCYFEIDSVTSSNAIILRAPSAPAAHRDGSSAPAHSIPSPPPDNGPSLSLTQCQKKQANLHTGVPAAKALQL